MLYKARLGYEKLLKSSKKSKSRVCGAALDDQIGRFLALGFDFEDGFALIRPTVRAHMMGDVILSAAFAANQMVERQRIVRPTPVTAAPRMFSFWQRTHKNAPLNSQNRSVVISPHVMNEAIIKVV